MKKMKEEQNIRQLPKDWKLKKLGDICDLQNGFAFKSTDYIDSSSTLIFRMSQIRPGGSLDLNHNAKFLPDNYVEKYKSFLLKEGDVIIAMTDMASETKILGLPTYFKSDGRNYLLNQRVGRLYDFDEDEIEVRFLRYILSSPNIIKYYKAFGKGALQINLGKDNILNAEVPVPPKPTQLAIVAKIEELFSELDKGIEQLKTAQQQLKTYRQSVLKWAFEGKLTAAWRGENAGVRIPLSPHEFAMAAEDTAPYEKESELPEGWKWVKLGELMESVRNGYSKKPDEQGRYKILRISSVRPNAIDINDVRLLENEIGVENSVVENDLLFTRYNGSIDFVGVCAKVPKISEKLFYPDKLVRCRPMIKEGFHSTYIEYASNSRFARQFVLSKIKTTAGQTGISGSDIKEIPIPLTSVEEQNQIVQEIESRISVADKMEESINQSLQQAEALRQSILKQAFEGKLVE